MGDQPTSSSAYPGPPVTTAPAGRFATRPLFVGNLAGEMNFRRRVGDAPIKQEVPPKRPNTEGNQVSPEGHVEPDTTTAPGIVFAPATMAAPGRAAPQAATASRRRAAQQANSVPAPAQQLNWPPQNRKKKQVEMIDLTAQSPPRVDTEDAADVAAKYEADKHEYGMSLIYDDLGFLEEVLAVLESKENLHEMHLRVIEAIGQIKCRRKELNNRIKDSERSSKAPSVPPRSSKSSKLSQEPRKKEPFITKRPPSPVGRRPIQLCTMQARRSDDYLYSLEYSHTICRHCAHACFHCQLIEEQDPTRMKKRNEVAWTEKAVELLTRTKKTYREHRTTQRENVTEVMKMLRYQMFKPPMDQSDDGIKKWQEDHAWIKKVLGFLENIETTEYPKAIREAVLELEKH